MNFIDPLHLQGVISGLSSVFSSPKHILQIGFPWEPTLAFLYSFLSLALPNATFVFSISILDIEVISLICPVRRDILIEPFLFARLLL